MSCCGDSVPAPWGRLLSGLMKPAHLQPPDSGWEWAESLCSRGWAVVSKLKTLTKLFLYCASGNPLRLQAKWVRHLENCPESSPPRGPSDHPVFLGPCGFCLNQDISGKTSPQTDRLQAGGELAFTTPQTPARTCSARLQDQIAASRSREKWGAATPYPQSFLPAEA